MPKSRWKRLLEASRHEALLAVDIYNGSRQARSLEAFLVHMHIAWLYLLHAKFERDGVDYRYFDSDGEPLTVDGAPKNWDLQRSVQERWAEQDDPVRRNLEFTIKLRNRIEHRFEQVTALATSGFLQALILNYERELSNAFGDGYSLADQLRFPVFVGTFTREGIQGMLASQQGLPRGTARLLAEYSASLPEEVAQDQRYEFRVNLVPRLGPRSEADLSLTFIREDELTPEQRDTIREMGRAGTVIVREQLRAVASEGYLKPSRVAQMVERQIPFKFSASSEFPAAWKKLQVRPVAGSSHPERTVEQYCVYDRPHGDYLYTQAFVNEIVKHTKTAEAFQAFLGRRPRAKST